MKRLKYWLILGSLLSPLSALAADPSTVLPAPISGLPGNSGDTFERVVVGYINIFLAVVGIIAVAYLIYGGFMYITSGGNEETAEQAKKIIQNSIIGLVVIVLSFTIITVIVRALFGQTA